MLTFLVDINNQCSLILVQTWEKDQKMFELKKVNIIYSLFLTNDFIINVKTWVILFKEEFFFSLL